ncbi:Lrp/AsnC family transcriptional regulator [Natrarchaeobius chitinivorans]|uniref:Lrp/AsnC family transcriptional regulator n=1 Tax=Natrarchaeobius chitinivorans TaxID=1679083 RepID=A0A3N6M693_NATCH|nr:Lrp/AsnC family transcriptional regulator [Natrarchaeobius chitinivorans]RQG90831.1 Lrp/AsnC family transcriptional regulator [Natrarchaeobius chitinivorans]
MAQDGLELDETDKGILQLLQHDARNYTTKEIGDAVGVSDTTVSNRIAALESEGVIEGYTVELDFERIGVNPKMLLVCTAPASEREALAEKAIEMDGVTEVRTVLAGERNLHVTTVGRSIAELSEISQRLEGIGLDLLDSGVVKSAHRCPFDHLGDDAVNP